MQIEIPPPAERNIWVVRPINKDIQGAAAHGRLCRIFDEEMNLWDVARQYKYIEETVLPAASKTDAILLVGPDIMLATLQGAFFRKFERVYVLTYNERHRNWIERWV